MKNIAYPILIIAGLLSAYPALSAGHIHYPAPTLDQFMAKMAVDGSSPRLPGRYRATPSCATDSNAGDPIYFKLADGRCSGD